jgi:hypothetical protein
MKQYIKENLAPILLGVSIGLTVASIVGLIEDIIVKIALINAG